MRHWIKLIAVSLFCLNTLVAGCQKGREQSRETSIPGTAAATAPTTTNTPFATSSDPVLVGAGDVASCDDLAGAKATAKLLDSIPGTVFVAGDLAYPDGSAAQFANCYGPTWGRHKSRTRPSPGNHEFHAGGATPYFDYFGADTGDPKKGYYSYDPGAWHVIVINSNCSELSGGCSKDSPEEQWLREDLAKHRAACTVAYWHHPLFSSGLKHGNDPEAKPFWQDLYAAKVDLVVNGHDHDYERFAPQDPDGKLDARAASASLLSEVAARTAIAHLASPNPIARLGTPIPRLQFALPVLSDIVRDMPGTKSFPQVSFLVASHDVGPRTNILPNVGCGEFGNWL
jgi:Calcineurin-like phosphoesterase